MAEAFAFTPAKRNGPLPSGSNSNGPTYVTPYMSTAPIPRSPFIPATMPLKPVSPWHPPVTLPPSAFAPQVAVQASPMARPRSWHTADTAQPSAWHTTVAPAHQQQFVWASTTPAAPAAAPLAPAAPVTAWAVATPALSTMHLMPSLAPPPAFAHGRRHSFGATAATPAWLAHPSLPAQMPATPAISVPPLVPGVPWTLAPPALPSYPLLHPALSGHDALVFDLSAPACAPHWRTPYGAQPLSEPEIATPATHPAVYTIRVTIDALPQWPITIESTAPTASPLPGLGLFVPLPNTGWAPPVEQPGPGELPVRLGDVFSIIWQSLQEQISHLDWAKISKSEEAAISRAYTRRCKGNEGAAAAGVRRIDFLLDKYMFHGLLPVDASFTEMRLITSEKK